MKKTLPHYLYPLSVKASLTILILTLCGRSYDAVAQTEVSYQRGATQLEDILPPSPEAALLTIAYNVLDLPERISQGTSLKVKYTYLADGTKVSALDASGAGLVYRRPFTYRRSSGGTLTFESAPFDSGRLTEAGTRYHITDHLGSVRAVINGNASTTTYPLTGFYSVDDFAPFGTKPTSNASTYLSLASPGTTVSLRDGFTGQEDQLPDFSIGYSDFGARQYSPSLSRWFVPDPMGEKYYDVSPYAYCAGNPVNLVDPTGAGPETLWDLASLGLGVKSLRSNVKNGKVFAAVLDGVGIVIDGAAVLTPFVPGGVGAFVKAIRGVDNTVDAVNIAKGADTVTDIVQAVNKTDEVVDAAKGTEAMKRGIINEAKTLDALGETKNTKSFTVRLEDGTIKTTIPDINNSTTIGEIKDVKTLNNTKQIQAEAKAAAEAGKDFIIYTGRETHVSDPVLKQYKIERLEWLGPQK